MVKQSMYRDLGLVTSLVITCIFIKTTRSFILLNTVDLLHVVVLFEYYYKYNIIYLGLVRTCY